MCKALRFWCNHQGRFSEVRRMTSVKNGWILNSLAPKRNTPPPPDEESTSVDPPPWTWEICGMDRSLWPGVWSWSWCREDGYLHGQGACRCRCDFPPDVQRCAVKDWQKMQFGRANVTPAIASFVFPSDMNYVVLDSHTNAGQMLVYGGQSDMHTCIDDADARPFVFPYYSISILCGHRLSRASIYKSHLWLCI